MGMVYDSKKNDLDFEMDSVSLKKKLKLMGLGIGTSTFMSVFYLAGTVITHDKLNNVVQGIIWAPAVATVFGVAAKGVQMAKLSIQRRKMDSILSEEDVEYLEGLKHFYNMMDDNTNEKNGYRDFFVDFLHKVTLPDDEEKSKELNKSFKVVLPP